MTSNRETARIVGILFIIATVAGLLGTSLTGSILGGPDYLVKISANENTVVAGALLEFIAAIGSASIAIFLYPVLKKYNEGFALAAVGFRLIEAVFYIVALISLPLLLALSKEFVSAGAPAASYFQTLGALILVVRDRAGFVFAVIAFCLGALMYYYIFYQTKLIPRWLSGWGIIAAVLLLSVVLRTLFSGQPFSVSGITILLVLPIAVQEMVLAVWLIVKGFNPSVIASEPHVGS